MKRIVVAGAGFAGVLAAKLLAKRLKKLKKTKEFEVTIIDRHPFHTMLTELHEVAAQRVEEDSIKISLEKVFAGRAVNVVQDEIKGLDNAANVLKGSKKDYPYDWLILASGSKPAFFGIKGVKDNSFTLWSYEDSVRLRDHIVNMFRQASLEVEHEKKKELLTFAVVGAGFTGVEMAGELAELVPNMCRRFEIDPGLVRIIELDLLDRACTVLPVKQSAKVERRLKKMKVDLLFNTGIKEAGADFISYAGKGQDPITEKTRTIIWTAGIEGSDLASGAQGLPKAGRGRIETDKHLRAKGLENVYVAGDNIFYVPEGEKESVPQMVENAEASAETAAKNVLFDATGDGQKHEYKPSFHGVMVCVGGRYGTANVGLPGRFFGLPSFLAMFAKHFINIIYFIKILGWNKIFSYLNHEFFTVRDKRSFVGGHLSNRSPSFFLVPLRMYMGFYWLREGILKVMEGWLQGPALTGFFTGANQFYERILNQAPGAAAAVAAATGAAETAAAATGAATTAAASAGQVFLNLNILGLARAILVDGGELAFKLQVGFVDWIVETFVLYSSPAQNIMQYVIVLSEILIGLALLGGLFTTLSGAYSLVLQLMFMTSTGLYISTWWMLFASIAMLFGAGRALSMDYYVMPWLKEQWKKVRFARKWYLYHD
ncbi:MAG: NAD(P)/FAD-dependent oxidoreductase [Clostridiales bacterium]|nr:NAD(P)/FAD-dependent oxidoreductase [Clostridiales bacterium]